VASLNPDKRDGELLCFKRFVDLDINRPCDVFTCSEPNHVLVRIDIHKATSVNVKRFVPEVPAFLLKSIKSFDTL
jgi:hypothetical protein